MKVTKRDIGEALLRTVCGVFLLALFMGVFLGLTFLWGFFGMEPETFFGSVFIMAFLGICFTISLTETMAKRKDRENKEKRGSL